MSPRSKQQFEEMREEKRTLIMDVALEHFANVGYHATTINHIARHAGISKGLMYNYFKSKEELLSEIISRSVSEIYHDFDTDRDGFLTPDEFEHFIRKVTQLLREKRSIWMLFFQMMMQKEVREVLLSGLFQVREASSGQVSDIQFIPVVYRLIEDYFDRKREASGRDYDAALELNMFLLTIKGFAVTWIYSDNDDDDLYNKTVDRIVETFR